MCLILTVINLTRDYHDVMISWCRIYCYAGIIMHEKIQLPCWTNIRKYTTHTYIWNMLYVPTKIKLNAEYGNNDNTFITYKIESFGIKPLFWELGNNSPTKFDTLQLMIWYLLNKYNMICLVLRRKTYKNAPVSYTLPQISHPTIVLTL